MPGLITLRGETPSDPRGGMLAAALVTLGFTLSPDSKRVEGDVQGGRGIEWSFIPGEVGLCGYDLDVAIKRGLDVDQPRGPQRWMATAAANYLGVSSERAGYAFYPYPSAHRLMSGGAVLCYEGTPATLPGSLAEHEVWALEATLRTLGYETDRQQLIGLDMREVRAGLWSTTTPVCLHRTAAACADSLDKTLELYHNDTWCGRADNTHPVAAMSSFFYNLGVLRAAVEHGLGRWVCIESGRKSVYLPAAADDSTWARAESFLTR